MITNWYKIQASSNNKFIWVDWKQNVPLFNHNYTKDNTYCINPGMCVEIANVM